MKIKIYCRECCRYRELADLSREKAAVEIERSLQCGAEKEKSNAENENSIKHGVMKFAARQEKRSDERWRVKESKETKEDKLSYKRY